MSFLRVPSDRVVDAVPVALVLILLSVPTVIPVAAPASMLHMWLWLRHPRSKSRYFIFASIVGFYLLLAGAPLILGYFEGVEYARGGVFYLVLMIFSASGILPILYRLISRCSLTDLSESTGKENNEESRGGISDLLALSVLCAIVFLVSQISRNNFDGSRGPAWDLTVTLVFSFVGLVAMRLNANCRPVVAFANFLGVSIVGYAILKLSLWSLYYARTEWFEGSAWLAGGSRWIEGLQWNSVGMVLIAVFPMICRYCGIALVHNRPHQVPSDGDADTREDGDSAQTEASSAGFLGVISQTVGHLSLIAMIALITLYPFTWTENFDDTGYRLAGWPFTYWTQQQLSSSSAPWYWTDSDIWTTVDFKTLALVADILLTAIAWILIIPILPIRNRLTRRSLRMGRTALAILFVCMLSYSIFGEPHFRFRGLDSINGVTVNYCDEKTGLFARVADSIEEEFRITGDQTKRGEPSDVTVENGNSETIDQVLALWSLRRLKLENCELLPRHVDRILRHPILSSLTLRNCDVARNKVDDLVLDGKLAILNVENEDQKFACKVDSSYLRGTSKPRDQSRLYEMELTTEGGEIPVPPKIKKLTLIVPNHVESHVELTGAQNLERLWLRNTVGEIPNSDCSLSISGAPVLYSIVTDNYQKVDLSIDTAPNLHSISGYLDRGSYCEARLTSLTIAGPTQLSRLCIDISECERLDLGAMRSGRMRSLEMSGHSGLRWEGGGVLQVGRMSKLLRGIPPGIFVENLVLHGLELNADVMRSLPSPSTLKLIDCELTGEWNKETLRRLSGLRNLHAACFAPSDRQLSMLLKSTPLLEGLHISGSKLTKLPALLGSKFIVEIDDLTLREGQSLGFNWARTDILNLRDSDLADDVLATWLIPNMYSMDLTNSKTTVDAVEALQRQWPLLKEVILVAEPEANAE